MEALEVFKGHLRSGLPESSAMVLLAIQGKMRCHQVSAAVGILREEVLFKALKDLRERHLITGNGMNGRRLTYERTETGDAIVSKYFSLATPVLSPE